MTSKIRGLLVLVLMGVLGMMLYSQTFRSPFMFDDGIAILENSSIRDLWDLGAIWRSFNTRVVLGVSFALNYAAGGYHVFGYHLFNTLIHILNAFLVYLLIQKTYLTPYLKKGTLAPHRGILALLGALLFLVHPVQTESVTYIWQRGTSLAAFFYLSAAVLYLHGRLRGRRSFIAAAFAVFGLALLTKEFTVVFPLMVLGYELFFFELGRAGRRRLWIRLLPFFLAVLVIPLLLMRETPATLEMMEKQRVVTQNQSLAGILSDMTRTDEGNTYSRKTHFLTQANAFRTYMRLFVYPVNQNVDYHASDAKNLSDPNTLLSVLFLLILFWGSAALFRFQRILSFAIYWVCLHLGLETFVMILPDVIFEHRLYLPLAGFSFFLPAVIWLLVRRPNRAMCLAAALILVFAVAAFRRNEVWKDPVTLWTDAYKKSPWKARVNHNLSAAYFADQKYREALHYSHRALEIDPQYVNAEHIAGFSHGKLGENKQMLEHCLRAVNLDPRNPKRYVDAAIAFGQVRLIDEGIEYCRKALGLNPSYPYAYDHLGYLQGLKGEHVASVLSYEKALESDSGYFPSLMKLGIYYATAGDMDRARDLFLRGMSAWPSHPGPYYSLGKVYEQQKNYITARDYYLKSLSMDARSHQVHERLAIVYRAMGQADKDDFHRQQSLSLKPPPPPPSDGPESGGSSMAEIKPQ